ncbi:uncharacterized protein LOC128649658 [Bombina bombina]|uniref:uncharacterized protein LOC128649658 n=1 Tax=Bombina bombina TaxID=8345 RepID=UPI00235B0441|nr:uncharacterized protein LOC128649658 [Bombina bombina]
MESTWKLQIRRQLKKRDRMQLGNYGSLVESYAQLLGEKYEDTQIRQGRESTEDKKDSTKSEEPSMCDRSVSQRALHNISDCVSCHDSQQMKEEIVTLQHHLSHVESEYQALLTRWIEEKKKEAERINYRNAKVERYWRLLWIKAQRNKTPVVSITSDL